MPEGRAHTMGHSLIFAKKLRYLFSVVVRENRLCVKLLSMYPILVLDKIFCPGILGLVARQCWGEGGFDPRQIYSSQDPWRGRGKGLPGQLNSCVKHIMLISGKTVVTSFKQASISEDRRRTTSQSDTLRSTRSEQSQSPRAQRSHHSVSTPSPATPPLARLVLVVVVKLGFNSSPTPG